MSSRRTLWEEGRRPGPLVVSAAAATALTVVVVDVALAHRLTLFFDVAFAMVCVAAALTVRPRDFFAVGVLPPLLMAGTILLLSIAARNAVADARDGLVQALVSGLAHHAGALVAGYGLTLVVLALRQIALRNSGSIRSRQRRRTSAIGQP